MKYILKGFGDLNSLNSFAMTVTLLVLYLPDNAQ